MTDIQQSDSFQQTDDLNTNVTYDNVPVNTNQEGNNDAMLPDAGAAAYVGAESGYNNGFGVWGRQQPHEEKPQEHTLQKPQEHTLQKPQEHTLQKPQEHTLQKSQEHTLQQEDTPISNNNILHVDSVNGKKVEETPAEEIVSEKNYMKQYFPTCEDIYLFSNEGELTVLNDEGVGNMERYRLKRIVTSHWYFFKHGRAKNDSLAKTIVNKLMRIKTDLTFSTFMLNKVKKWLK